MLGQTQEDLAYWNKQMQKISVLTVFQEIKEKFGNINKEQESIKKQLSGSGSTSESGSHTPLFILGKLVK